MEHEIDYKQSKEALKELKNKFILFSCLALFVIFSISFLAISYHRNILNQQKLIIKVHNIFIKQTTIFSNISNVVSSYKIEEKDLYKNILKDQIKDQIARLEITFQDLKDWIKKEKLSSLDELERQIIQKNISAKLHDFLSDIKIILDPKSSLVEEKKSIVNIIKVNDSDHSTYNQEVMSLIEQEYLKNINTLKNIGVAIILLCLFEIFLLWFILFRPLYQTVLGQNRKILESALKVQSAARSRTDFLANISHEIRTPMTAILGYAELIKSGGKEVTPTKINESIEIINQNAEHLLSLLDEVLDVSKMESSEFNLILEKTELSKILTDIKSLLDVKAKEKNLELKFRVLGLIPKYVNVDVKRLKQILFNILGNAIKFTHQGSVELEILSSNSERKLIFRIIDTGCGIPKDKRKRIFTPFEQAYTSANRQYSGTGLGLSLSRGLARRMNGDVVVEKSKLGVGTTFRVEIDPGEISTHTFIKKIDLNYKKSKEKVNHNADIKLDGINILVVDDAKENARLFSAYLKSAGASVEVLNEGFSVLKTIKENNFDIILLDLQMPGKDGYQVISEIKAAGITTPVCALTAHAMAEEIEKTKKLGFYSHITKPISKEDLVAEILSVLS